MSSSYLGQSWPHGEWCQTWPGILLQVNAHSVSIRMRRMMAYLLTNRCWTPHWAWASDVPAKMDSHSPQWKFRVVESPNKSSTNHHWLVISTHISILCWLKPLFGRCLKNTMKWRTNGPVTARSIAAPSFDVQGTLARWPPASLPPARDSAHHWGQEVLEWKL